MALSLHCRDTELLILCPHVEVSVLPAGPRHPRLPRPARPQVPALVVGVDVTKPPEPGSCNNLGFSLFYFHRIFQAVNRKTSRSSWWRAATQVCPSAPVRPPWCTPPSCRGTCWTLARCRLTKSSPDSLRERGNVPDDFPFLFTILPTIKRFSI